MLDDKHTVELAPGIVDKFYATYEHGVTPVPVGTSPVNGVRWRSIIDKAHLNDSEMQLFLIWLEEMARRSVGVSGRCLCVDECRIALVCDVRLFRVRGTGKSQSHAIVLSV